MRGRATSLSRWAIALLPLASVLAACGDGDPAECPAGVWVEGECLPTDCADRTCPPASVCREGACVALACLEVSCPPGEGCAAGVCYPEDCQVRSCPGLGEVCLEEECTPASCVGHDCPAGQRCALGHCYPVDCDTRICAGYGEVCVDEACQERSCVGVECPVGLACAGGRCYPTECGQGACPGEDEICVEGRCIARACALVDCGAGPCIDGWCCPAEPCTLALQCQTQDCSGVAYRCQFDPELDLLSWQAQGERCTDGEACTVDDACVGEACRGVPRVCDRPPEAACRGGQRVSYRSPGTCEQGACSYEEQVEDCPAGCTAGECDPVSCGAVTCDAGELCEADACRCGGTGPDCAGGVSSACCGSECVNLGTDARHCGGCGNACGPNQLCQGQACACAPGFGDCTAEAGCESTLGGLDACRGCLESCRDGNACTDDLCDPDLGCQQVPNSAGCEDGDACTQGDACSGGACQPGALLPCDDGNACTQDACEPATGCLFPPLAAGAEGACPSCQDCDGQGACAPVGAGQSDPGCDQGSTDCPTPDTCDGWGGCNHGSPLTCSDHLREGIVPQCPPTADNSQTATSYPDGCGGGLTCGDCRHTGAYCSGTCIRWVCAGGNPPPDACGATWGDAGWDCWHCQDGPACTQDAECSFCLPWTCADYGRCPASADNSTTWASHDDGCGWFVACGDCRHTGAFCNTTCVRWVCAGGNPPPDGCGATWVDVGGDCWHCQDGPACAGDPDCSF